MATTLVDNLRAEALERFDEAFESVAVAVAYVPEKDAAFLG
jgi:hypothetical protein